MILAVAEATWLGIAAAISSIAGIILGTLSYRQGRKAAQRKAEQDMHEQLLTARKEAEELSAELHKIRMEQPK